MRFGSPDSFWFLLLIPLLFGLYVWSFRRRQVALRRFGAEALMTKLTSATSWTRQTIKAALLLVAFLFLVVALVEPRFGTKLEMLSRRGVDVIVALDTSLSMLAEDMPPNRLLRARLEIESLIDRLEGDRIGLVAFSGQSFVLCPLTLDYGAAKLFLDSIDTGLIPAKGTAIAQAVRTGTEAFGSEEQKYKALVLITDGEDHAGEALEAARQAKQAGVRIFAVGIGTPEGELIPIKQDGRTEFLRDRQGNVVKTRLGEATLVEMAKITNGGYVRSQRGRVGLDEVYAQVSNMEKRELGSRKLSQYKHRFQWPLAVAILLIILESLMSDRRRVSEEWQGRFA
ncbi:VWA domain-containing protein [bacterium]|nr:VWA domain-containing protein [bacterium]